jgi:methylenetetrahydrofolate dehydrogenase (NADP+) / methenyltetrahydrofolate cyclohydrolase
MTAQIIDGKAIAQTVRQEVAAQVAQLQAKGIIPGLAVVLVGDNPASHVYVRNKVQQTREVGMASFEHRLPASVTGAELLYLIQQLNADNAVDGILVQLPLPPSINADQVMEAIDPAKDVDGFHPINAGRLMTGRESIVPCTPMGSLMLLHSVQKDLSGLNALVLGRSNIVGKPMAQLLLRENCTVTIAHSRTRNVKELCRQADILVAAIGQPELVRGDWIKPGALVIDVGINRVSSSEMGKTKLVGDVAFEKVCQIARAITPVPGGVGPMTIACLLKNTLASCIRKHSP